MGAKRDKSRFPYPRRYLLRLFLRRLSRIAFGILSKFEVAGRENLPQAGPLLVVANHFSFVDPVAIVRVSPWPIEFVGGFQMPNAPPIVTWIPKAWGYYPVYRGAFSRYALRGCGGRARTAWRPWHLSRGGQLGQRAAAGTPRHCLPGGSHRGADSACRSRRL